MSDTVGTKGQFRVELSDSEIDSILVFIGKFYKHKITPKEIVDRVNYINHVKDTITGRLAGDIDDYLIMSYLSNEIAASQTKSDVKILEIGSLFGGSSLIMLKNALDANSQSKIYCVDPLDGYYTHQAIGQLEDSISKQPITKKTLTDNLSLFHFSEGREYEVWQNLSTSLDVIENAKKMKFDLLYIDGDHSYSGIAFDWETYSPFMKENAYVVIDNVFDMAWPEVSDYIYQKVLPNSEWEFVGFYSRSLILKKSISSSDKEARSQFLNQYRIFDKAIKNINYRIKDKKLALEKLEKSQTQQSIDLLKKISSSIDASINVNHEVAEKSAELIQNVIAKINKHAKTSSEGHEYSKAANNTLKDDLKNFAEKSHKDTINLIEITKRQLENLEKMAFSQAKNDEALHNKNDALNFKTQDLSKKTDALNLKIDDFKRELSSQLQQVYSELESRISRNLQQMSQHYQETDKKIISEIELVHMSVKEINTQIEQLKIEKKNLQTQLAYYKMPWHKKFLQKKPF